MHYRFAKLSVKVFHHRQKIIMGITLDLGLPAKEIVLLALTLLVSAITVIGGQATIMQGTVHRVLFAAFLFLAIVP